MPFPRVPFPQVPSTSVPKKEIHEYEATLKERFKVVADAGVAEATTYAFFHGLRSFENVPEQYSAVGPQ